MWAFDLIELDGDDLRREPLNVRKATLASVLARAAPGLQLNEHMEADGPDVFHHACMLGLEGIVSKRKDLQYRSGRAALDQVEESECSGGEAGSRRGLVWERWVSQKSQHQAAVRSENVWRLAKIMMLDTRRKKTGKTRPKSARHKASRCESKEVEESCSEWK